MLNDVERELSMMLTELFFVIASESQCQLGRRKTGENQR